MIVSESFVIVEWSDSGVTSRERPIAALHVHRSDDEAWYVLIGRLGFRVGDEEREIGPGESILVARGTPHAYWNGRAGPTRYLLVVTPRIHALIEALHSGERSDWARIFEEHDSGCSERSRRSRRSGRDVVSVTPCGTNAARSWAAA